SAASELWEIIEAGAKYLNTNGIELQPVKPDMLRLPDDQTQVVMTACNLLLAALLEYEQGLWDEQHAKSALQLVQARIRHGKADAVVQSLFYGPTRLLLRLACDRAPIAFSGLAKASPQQNIIDRV